jgi:hypothetical protein
MSKDVTQAQHHEMQQTSSSDNKYENYTEINLCP